MRGFQRGAFQHPGFQQQSVAGDGGSTASKRRRRQKHNAHLLAEQYNRLIERPAAQAIIASVVTPYIKTVTRLGKTPETDAPPRAEIIDFVQLLRDAQARQAFYEAAIQIAQQQEDEELIVFLLTCIA